MDTKESNGQLKVVDVADETGGGKSITFQQVTGIAASQAPCRMHRCVVPFADVVLIHFKRGCGITCALTCAFPGCVKLSLCQLRTVPLLVHPAFRNKTTQLCQPILERAVQM